MLRRLAPYMSKYKIYAILCPILMILEVSVDIIIPYLMSFVVDTGIANRDISYILRIGLLMIGFALFGMTTGIISTHLGAKAGYGFAAEVRADAYRSVQRFSFANIDAMSVPSLITRLTTDIDMLGMVTMMSLRMAIRAPFMMLFALIMSVTVNAQLALIFAVAIPVVVIMIVFMMRKAMPIFSLMQKKVDRINAIVQEDLIGIRVIKSFNREPHEEKRFGERNDALRDTALKAISLIILLMPVLNLVIYACIVAVLWFGGQMVIGGTMAPGELIAFITYITQIMMSLMMLSFYFMQLTRGQASAGRVIEVLDTESEIKNPVNPLTEVPDGSITFDDVCFRYATSSENILNDIDLSIQSGEVIGIIGSTGSSKSTLVQMIPRLYDVSRGSVSVGGHDVRDYDMEVLRDQVAFVLQKNTLVTGTIRSNMQWGKEDATDEEIIDALKKAQAWEFVSQYPETIDHPVAQGGANFSGGQRQRLTIARALIKQPKVLILDDSTSAVDMHTDQKIRNTFKNELDEITTLIIAQRIASIQDADRIIVLDKGQIESIGTHEELLASSPIYKEISETQERGLMSA